MNQIIKENNSKFNTVIVTSGSILAAVGTYFLIKNRQQIYDLIRSFKQSQLNQRVNKNQQNKSIKNVKSTSKVTNMINSIESQIKQSHERVVNDLKDLNINTNKSLNEKRKSIESWWNNTRASQTTYFGHLKGTDEENEETAESKPGETINYNELTFETLLEKFSTIQNLKHKLEIVKALQSKAESKHLIILFELLNQWFNEISNEDLFSKYTYINTNGDFYTDMLIQLLMLISELTTKTNDQNLKNLIKSNLVVNILISYVFNLEKNKNNAKRKSRVEKIKYLSLNILSNLLEHINENHSSYDSNVQRFIEGLLCNKQGVWSKIDSTKSVFSTANTKLNSLIYLKLLENLIKVCVHFDFNKNLMTEPTCWYFYLTSDFLIEDLKVYEKEYNFKEHLESVYDELTKLRNKSKSSTAEKNSNIEIIDIQCEITTKENNNSTSNDNSSEPVNEMKVFCLVRDVQIKN